MAEHKALNSLEEFLEAPLDYNVEGDGTAGQVVAARLTEDPQVTIEVLEAGKLRLGGHCYSVALYPKYLSEIFTRNVSPGMFPGIFPRYLVLKRSIFVPQ